MAYIAFMHMFTIYLNILMSHDCKIHKGLHVNTGFITENIFLSILFLKYEMFGKYGE